MEPEKPASGRSQAALKSWGRALVKTGTEHLDLSMVRQGKKALKDAAAMVQDDDSKP